MLQKISIYRNSSYNQNFCTIDISELYFKLNCELSDVGKFCEENMTNVLADIIAIIRNKIE